MVANNYGSSTQEALHPVSTIHTAHRRSCTYTHYRWCQSSPVELAIGDPSTDRYRIPRDLLRRRSRYFREQLDAQINSSTESQAAVPTIHLPLITPQTAEDFFIWSLSPEPRIDFEASFENTIKLGVFGWAFKVPSLSNQVNDLIRTSLADGKWKLSAALVDEVYAATAAPTPSASASTSTAADGVSPLRELIREALGQLPRSTVESDEGREAWKATILKHAQFAWDYIEAGGKEWSKQKFLEDRCRFHDHKGVYIGDDVETSLHQCAFEKEELFPSDEEQRRRDTLRKITGKEWEVGRGADVVEPMPVAMPSVGDIAEHPVSGTPSASAAAPTADREDKATTTATKLATGLTNNEDEPKTSTATSYAATAPVSAPPPFNTKSEIATHLQAQAPAAQAQAQPNGYANLNSDAFEDEVNGTITLQSMIDKASSHPKPASLSSPTHIKQVVPETLMEQATPVAVPLVNGNANMIIDSESAVDDADGVTVTSESVRDEPQSMAAKVNGEGIQINRDSMKSPTVTEVVLENGNTVPTGPSGKNKKKKKGSMSKVGVQA